MNTLHIQKIALLVMSLASFSQANDEAIREERVEHAGVIFRVVRLEPKRVQPVWKDAEDKPFRTFDRIQADRAAKGQSERDADAGGDRAGGPADRGGLSREASASGSTWLMIRWRR